MLVIAALLLVLLADPYAAGSLTYQVDPVAGDDANPPGKPWLRKQLFISNSIDSTEPIPIGIMLSKVKHFRVQGGDIDGSGKTTLLYEWKNDADPHLERGRR